MLSGLVFGEQAAHDQVKKHLTEVVGPETAREVNSLIERSVRPRGFSLAAALGGAALVVGALGVFLHIRRCLSVIWRLESPERKGVIESLMGYLLAVVMVLGVGMLLLLSLAASAALPWLVDFLGNDFPVGARFWHWLDAGLSFALLALFFALVFRVMSGRRILLRHVVYGAVISALLLTVGKTLIGLYLGYTGTASAYGGCRLARRVPGLGLLLQAQIIFFGAELVQARRTRADWLPN